MVMNACSTLVEFFALVSRKGMPISSANACSNTHSHVQQHAYDATQPDQA
jgi:hypothetical protein